MKHIFEKQIFIPNDSLRSTEAGILKLYGLIKEAHELAVEYQNEDRRYFYNKGDVKQAREILSILAEDMVMAFTGKKIRLKNLFPK